MNKQKDTAVEKLDVESLIVDLLACGLGGCIILFFIFSIKIIGAGTVMAHAALPTHKNGSGNGYISMIGDAGNHKRMGSVRIIQFSHLSENSLSVLQSAAESGSRFWDISSMEKDDSLLSTLTTQVHVKDHSISFIIMADGMRELNFSFPEELKQKLTETESPERKTLNIYIIEGNSDKSGFTGRFKSGPHTIERITDVKVKIKIGKVANIERLIEVTVPGTP